MRATQVFWGLIIVIIGLIFLGMNLGWWSGDVWRRLLQLWPLILIGLGLRSIMRNDVAFLVSLIVLLAAGALIATTVSPLRTETRTNSFGLNREWSFGGQKLSGESATFSQSLDIAGNEIFLADLGGHYTIRLSGDNSTQVAANLTGPKEIVERLELVKSGSEIQLKERAGSFSFFAARIDDVSGTITLPRTTATRLDLSGLTNITLEDMNSNLTVKASGASTVSGKSSIAMNPTVDLSGTGKIALDQCQGVGRIEMSGAGKISAENCALSSLTIDMSGAGEADIKAGTIVDLNVEASGAAKVRVPKPSGTIQQEMSGATKIEYR